MTLRMASRGAQGLGPSSCLFGGLVLMVLSHATCSSSLYTASRRHPGPRERAGSLGTKSLPGLS